MSEHDVRAEQRFKNILVNGAGIQAAWLPTLALLGYALLFFTLAAWRLRSE